MNRNLYIKLLVCTITLLTSSIAYCQQADTAIIKTHLKTICKMSQPRNYLNTLQLDSAANYIKAVFKQYADTAFEQTYIVDGRTYRNIICSFGSSHKKRLVVGAHYDVCGFQEGADDNASGVVGLLELARLLKGHQLKNRIDLVA